MTAASNALIFFLFSSKLESCSPPIMTSEPYVASIPMGSNNLGNSSSTAIKHSSAGSLSGVVMELVSVSVFDVEESRWASGRVVFRNRRLNGLTLDLGNLKFCESGEEFVAVVQRSKRRKLGAFMLMLVNV